MIDPFRDATLAIWTIVFITAWKVIGFSVLIFSAGLTGVSSEYLDAASVDGASKLQTIRHITVPLLSPTIMFMVLLTVLFSAQWAFPMINVLTQGGPRDATTNIYYLLWQFGFRTFNIGVGTAAALLFLAGFGVLAFLFTRLQERFSFHDS
jgi:multiple sugar transport system permease protein